VLPDHVHMIWTLPEGDSDYPTRWRLIKSGFTHALPDAGGNQLSRQLKGERCVWQRRYWEHFIRDDQDLLRHVEYIHYNPVHHGLTKTPGEWPYTSFHRFVQRGLYPADWGATESLLLLQQVSVVE
jgi:putative transposase